MDPVNNRLREQIGQLKVEVSSQDHQPRCPHQLQHPERHRRLRRLAGVGPELEIQEPIQLNRIIRAEKVRVQGKQLEEEVGKKKE